MNYSYSVYFEIFGKKLKKTIVAENEIKACQAILDSVIFHKIVEENAVGGHKEGDDVFTNLMNMFGMDKNSR